MYSFRLGCTGYISAYYTVVFSSCSTVSRVFDDFTLICCEGNSLDTFFIKIYKLFSGFFREKKKKTKEKFSKEFNHYDRDITE